MTLLNIRRWWPGFGRRRNPPQDTRLRYSKYLGFHADEDNGLEDPRLVTRIFELCNVNPANMDGAMALFRDVAHDTPTLPNHPEFTDTIFNDMRVQRQAAASLGCESPTIVFVPFTESQPGYNGVDENNTMLAELAIGVARYIPENIICAFGNLTSGNFMPDEPSAAVRNAAWFALEARAIDEVFIPAGLRWCASDDLGITALCGNVVTRRAAWASAGIDPDDCEFFCAHSYVDAGYVPALFLLAEASFARASITTPIRHTEIAYGFLGGGNTIAEDEPWLHADWAIDYVDPVHGSHPQANTWTRLLCEWYRTNRKHGLIFDWTMFVRNYGNGPELSPWGRIFVHDQETQPTFVAPEIGTIWFKTTGNNTAQEKAYSIRLSNTPDSTPEEVAAAEAAATAAAQRVLDGYIFDIAA